MFYLGSTRVVILTKNNAVKIARVRPIKSLFKVFILIFLPNKRKKFQVKYKKNFFIGMWKYLFAGVYANKLEHKHWNQTKSPSLAPTEKYLLYGFIVIQERARKVSMKEVNKEHPYPQISKMHGIELNTPEQFGRLVNGKIVIVDYGSRLTINAINDCC